MLFRALAHFSAIASASSVLPGRQAPLITIASVRGEGPACPQGSYSPVITTDGTVANIIFDSYIARFVAGETPPGIRDLDCDLIFTFHAPIGCTQFTPQIQYHGFAQIEQGGVTGDVEPSYVFSQGQLTGVNTQPTRFDSKTQNDFTRLDAPTAKVTVRNANEQDVRFESRTRLRVITTSSEAQGNVFMDAIDLILMNQQTC